MFGKINQNKIKNLAIFCVLLIFVFGSVQAEFADIDVTHPYYHAIESLQNDDVVEGYVEIDGQRSFRALQPVLRSEAVKILVLASKREISRISEFEEDIFDDVKKEDWFYSYVSKAAEDKIVKGFADGKFHPAAQVTRAEMLKMAIVGFGIPEEELQATEDEQWFEPYFKFGKSFRIISGDEETHQSINRGEVAEIIYRTQKVAESGFEKKYTYSGSGKASYYNEGFAGNPTANGEIYDPGDLTAAHRTLPFETRVKVKYGDKFVIVRINDRGPYHKNRIIDLSEKAFSLLAPISRGVIDIDFAVYTDPNDERPEIPDFIRENLSEKAQNPAVPDEVATIISRLRGEDTEAEKRRLEAKTQPIFPSESIGVLPKSFFETVELRQNFPRKYLKGSVLKFSGSTLEQGHRKVTVFLQEIIDGKSKSEEQILYSGEISGKNFSFPIILDSEGMFFIGVVLDDERNSRTETIEVVDLKDYRKFAGSDQIFLNDFAVRVLPEEATVFFDFKNNESTDLQKIVFSQNGLRQKILYIYGGIQTLPLPYDFFAEFEEFRNLAVDLFVAESKDGTLDTQISAWKKSNFKNFQIEWAFPDTEDDRISIQNFARYYKELTKANFRGRNTDQGLNLHDEVYITLPNKRITTYDINFEDDQFYFNFTPADWGRYIIEITSDQGEILFNRAIYFSRKIILPIMEEEMISVRGETVSNVRFWINSIRQEAGKNALISDYKLNNFAQKYADQMATENFISHTTPTGETFEDRTKRENLHGEFGENLSFGTTLDLALQGLKNSASHYKNMTSLRWKTVGVGIKESKRGWYVVNVFGR